MLPKFDPSENILVDDHLQSFYSAIEGLWDGEHEDVVSKEQQPHGISLCLQIQSQTRTHLREYSEVNMQYKKLMQL